LACLQKPPQDEDDVQFLREVQFALASVGPEAQDAVPALVRSLSASQEELRASAAFALGRIGPKARAAVPELRKNLDNPSDIVRLASLSALMELQPGERRLAIVAAPLLLKALDSEHEIVRAEAARGLGRLGELGRSSLPRLKRLLQDASPLVREAAAESIKKLEG
jgi:hypothetical protein